MLSCLQEITYMERDWHHIKLNVPVTPTLTMLVCDFNDNEKVVKVIGKCHRLSNGNWRWIIYELPDTVKRSKYETTLFHEGNVYGEEITREEARMQLALRIL
jgi:hypothetical protein